MTGKSFISIHPTPKRGFSASSLDQASSISPANSRESNYAPIGTICVICGIRSCSLITHRIQILQVTRSAHSESIKQQKGFKSQSISPSIVVDHDASSSASSRNRQSSNAVQTSYPVDDVPAVIGDKSLFLLLHEFFDNQSRSLLQFQRQPSFDIADFLSFRHLSMIHPALGLSFIAMATTFTSIYRHNLPQPDAALNAIYGQAILELRVVIDAESALVPSEATITAAINLCLCSGIAFCNPQDASLHWQGVLALLQKPRQQPLSGPISMLLVQVEHWLVLTADASPRYIEQQEVLHHSAPPAQRYGGRLETILSLSDSEHTGLAQRALQMCRTACRATEMLEYQARRDFLDKEKPYDTYFLYLRNIVTEANAIIYSQTSGTGNVIECINVATGLFLLIALRRTPWRAPVVKLCHQLKRSITQTMSDRTSGLEEESDGWTIERRRADWGSRLYAVYIWAVHMGAIAAVWCREEDLVCWADQLLRPIIADYIEMYSEDWRNVLEKDLSQLVWSTTFLSDRLKQIWDECESLVS